MQIYANHLAESNACFHNRIVLAVLSYCLLASCTDVVLKQHVDDTSSLNLESIASLSFCPDILIVSDVLPDSEVVIAVPYQTGVAEMVAIALSTKEIVHIELPIEGAGPCIALHGRNRSTAQIVVGQASAASILEVTTPQLNGNVISMGQTMITVPHYLVDVASLIVDGDGTWVLFRPTPEPPILLALTRGTLEASESLLSHLRGFVYCVATSDPEVWDFWDEGLSKSVSVSIGAQSLAESQSVCLSAADIMDGLYWNARTMSGTRPAGFIAHSVRRMSESLHQLDGVGAVSDGSPTKVGWCLRDDELIVGVVRQYYGTKETRISFYSYSGGQVTHLRVLQYPFFNVSSLHLWQTQDGSVSFLLVVEESGGHVVLSGMNVL